MNETGNRSDLSPQSSPIPCELTADVARSGLTQLTLFESITWQHKIHLGT